MTTSEGRVEIVSDDEQVREMLDDPDRYFEAARQRAETYAKDYAKRFREQLGTAAAS